jgi:predicted transcriptional regulator
MEQIQCCGEYTSPLQQETETAITRGLKSIGRPRDWMEHLNPRTRFGIIVTSSEKNLILKKKKNGSAQIAIRVFFRAVCLMRDVSTKEGKDDDSVSCIIMQNVFHCQLHLIAPFSCSIHKWHPKSFDGSVLLSPFF